MDLANVLAKMGMPNAFDEVTATPPAPDAQVWLNPDPRTLNMKVHGEWQESRVCGDVTRYRNDHVGFWMFGNEYGHFPSGGPGLNPEEACQKSSDQHVNWRRAINQGLWVIAGKSGEAFMQLKHETDAVALLYAYRFRILDPSPSNSPPEFPSSEGGLHSVAGNANVGTDIGLLVTATDPDSDPLSNSLGGLNADSFDIISSTGQLRTKAALDYEDKKSYTVTVLVSDGKNVNVNPEALEDDSATVTVTDVNEPPSAPF